MNIEATVNLISSAPAYGGGRHRYYQFELLAGEQTFSADDLADAVQRLGFTDVRRVKSGGYPAVQGKAPSGFKIRSGRIFKRLQTA